MGQFTQRACRDDYFLAEQLSCFFNTKEELDSYLNLAKKMLGEDGKVSFAFSWSFMAFFNSFAFFFYKRLWKIGFAFMLIFYIGFLCFILEFLGKENATFNSSNEIFSFGFNVLLYFFIFWLVLSIIIALSAKYYVLKEYFTLLDENENFLEEAENYKNSSNVGRYIGIILLCVPAILMFGKLLAIACMILSALFAKKSSNGSPTNSTKSTSNSTNNSRPRATIGAAIQQGKFIRVEDEQGRYLFNLNGTVVGYTSHSVSVRRDNWIYTYNEKGQQINVNHCH